MSITRCGFRGGRRQGYRKCRPVHHPQCLSLAKLSSIEKTGTAVYRSKMSHGGNKLNFEMFTPLEFIAAITQHIPERLAQMVRYVGWYSNRMCGDR
ncbi:MAG: transposase [Proteobacteria bacterium]|nr:transposase [Pseudomonadota bacterium]